MIHSRAAILFGNFEVLADGRGFVMIRGTGDMIGTELRVVLNWFRELERMAPL